MNDLPTDITSSWLSTGVSNSPYYTSPYYMTYNTSSAFVPTMLPKIEESISNELKINIKKSQIKFNFNL